MRRIINSTLALLLLTVTISCSKDREEKEALRSYYLSQDRDENLVGIWLPFEDETIGDEYRADGTVKQYYTTTSGEFTTNKGSSDEYWFTKSDTLNILKAPESSFYGSIETRINYKIEGDKLYTKDLGNGNYYLTATKKSDQ